MVECDTTRGPSWTKPVLRLLIREKLTTGDLPHNHIPRVWAAREVGRPATAAGNRLIATLIRERPVCTPCIATRALATAEDVEATFRHIEHVLEVRRIEPGRCGACGLIDAVELVKRPRP